MSFGSPLGLLALLAIPAVLGMAALVARRRPKSPVAHTNLAVLEAVMGPARRRRRRLIPAILLVLALGLAATAAGHPQARRPVLVDNATIVLLVDVSGSMSARDVEPTRLDAAVAAMRSFVRKLPKGFKVGLVQFSDSPTVLAAPTADHERVAQTLDLLTPDSGTAIGAGLLSATRLVQSSLRQAGYVRVPGRRLPAAIVLLSDGNQTQGPIQPLPAAKTARQAGIVVDTVALGTPHGILGYGSFARRVAPDPPLMAAIAKVTGGETSTATNPGQLSSFYRGVDSSFGHVTKTQDVASWFAGAAALLLAAAMLLSRRLTGPLS
jgi:Ca-activated chloride channel family protein